MLYKFPFLVISFFHVDSRWKFHMEWWNPHGFQVGWNGWNGCDPSQNIFHMEWVESIWNDMESIWIPCGIWGESKDLSRLKLAEKYYDLENGKDFWRKFWRVVLLPPFIPPQFVKFFSHPHVLHSSCPAHRSGVLVWHHMYQCPNGAGPFYYVADLIWSFLGTWVIFQCCQMSLVVCHLFLLFLVWWFIFFPVIVNNCPNLHTIQFTTPPLLTMNEIPSNIFM